MKLIAGQESFKTLLFNWGIWHNCNKSCTYCTARYEMPEQFKKKRVHYILVARKLKSLNTRMYIGIEGGEPVLNPDLLEILEILKEDHISINIFTNGTGSFELYKKILDKKNCTIQFSIHMESYKSSDLLMYKKLNELYPKRIYASLLVHTEAEYIPKMNQVLEELKEFNIHYIYSYLMDDHCKYVLHDQYTYDYLNTFPISDCTSINFTEEEDPNRTKRSYMNMKYQYEFQEQTGNRIFTGCLCRSYLFDIDNQSIVYSCFGKVGHILNLKINDFDTPRTCIKNVCGNAGQELMYPKYIL